MNLDISGTFLQLITFLKKVDVFQHPDQSIENKTNQLFSLLAIDIPVMMLLALLIGGLEMLELFDSENHKFNEMMELLPKWSILLLGVVIIPFFEEVIFRSWLKASRHYIYFFILIVACSSLYSMKFWLDLDESTTALWIAGAVLLSMVIYFAFIQKIGQALERRWAKYFPLIFYFSALLFGFVHISNYELSKEIIILSPILVLPQCIMGLFLGYLRVRFGLLWSYAMHALHNGLFICIPLFLMEK